MVSAADRICRAGSALWTSRVPLWRFPSLICWTSTGSTPWMIQTVRTGSSARCHAWEGSLAGTSSRRLFGTWHMSTYSPVSSLLTAGYICNTWIYEIVTRHPKNYSAENKKAKSAPKNSFQHGALGTQKLFKSMKAYVAQTLSLKQISTITVSIKQGTEISIGCQRNQTYSLLNKPICGCMIKYKI